MTNRKELDREFFKGKRPWSKIKDEVLGKYLKPYLAKVKMLRKEIFLIDTFAGPGKFDDGEPGSPLMMVQKAREMAPNQYKAIFVNNEKAHHDSIIHLFGVGSPLGDLIAENKVIPMFGDAKKFLSVLEKLLSDQTVFLYLDPYGLEGCEFSTWLPFIQREKKSSTEIMVNINFTAVRRFASRRSYLKGIMNKQIEGHHERLNDVFGGSYWKDVLLDPNLKQEDAEEMLMGIFKERILKYIKYVGYCPVKEKPKSLTKFYIMFLSNSDDGFLLMNDFMCEAYNKRLTESMTAGLPLFQNQKVNWEKNRDNSQLKTIIKNLVKEKPNKTRIKYWNQICIDFFMKYHSTEYRNSVKELCNEGSLIFENVSGGNLLNNDCILSIP